MPGNMKPEAFNRLIEEANQLGIETDGFTPSPGDTDRLKMNIALRTEEIAIEQVAKARLAAAGGGVDEDTEFSGFDEAAGKTRGVLVRLVEFTAWIPIKIAEEKQLSMLTLANGITGFEAGEHEKVVSIDTLDTDRRKRIPQTDDPSGPYIEYSAHVVKVVLANNVSTKLLHEMIDIQGGEEPGQEPDPRIVLPDAPKPNRAQRRKMR